jgi:hypothetical protein
LRNRWPELEVVICAYTLEMAILLGESGMVFGLAQSMKGTRAGWAMATAARRRIIGKRIVEDAAANKCGLASTTTGLLAWRRRRGVVKGEFKSEDVTCDLNMSYAVSFLKAALFY